MTQAQVERAGDLTVLADEASLWRAAAEQFVACAERAVRAHGRFLVALAGGSTPQGVYDLLASESYARRVDWVHAEVFWGDERSVPPDDPASNHRMAREHLLERVAIPEVNVHRIRGEDAPEQAASSYEKELRAAFRTPHGSPRLDVGARFDLVLLGMGPDGHTASLFPGSAAVQERERWVAASHAAIAPRARVTLTPPVINAAAIVVFVVAGTRKATMLRRVLRGPYQPDVLPAQAVAPLDGRLRWLVDADAAAELGAS